MRKVDKERRVMIKRVWDSGRKHRDLQWWKDYFFRVAGSDFLTNRNNNGTFRAPFQWTLMEKNMNKIMEGNYDNPKKKPPPAMKQGNKDALEAFVGKED